MSVRMALAISAQDGVTLENQLEAVIGKYNELNDKYNTVVKERDALLEQNKKLTGTE